MNSLRISYQAVIEHVAGDIGGNGDFCDGSDGRDRLVVLHDWLVCRRDALEKRRARTISGFYLQLEGYLQQCETFWKKRHGRTYEKKMDELLEVKKRVTKIYSLSGWDACYALLLAIKPMRGILPLRQYDEHAPALAALEAIKKECDEQLGTYIKFNIQSFNHIF